MPNDTDERIPLREYWEEYTRQKQTLGCELSPREYHDAIERIQDDLDKRPDLFENPSISESDDL